MDHGTIDSVVKRQSEVPKARSFGMTAVTSFGAAASVSLVFACSAGPGSGSAPFGASPPPALTTAPSASSPGPAFSAPTSSIPFKEDLGASCNPNRSIRRDGPALIVTDPAVLSRFPLDRTVAQIITTGK